MSNEKLSPMELMEHFFVGTMTPEESEEFLAILESDEKMGQLFIDNIICDFFLREREKSLLPTAGITLPSIAAEPFLLTGNMNPDELNQLITAERNAKPIVRSSFHEMNPHSSDWKHRLKRWLGLESNGFGDASINLVVILICLGFFIIMGGIALVDSISSGTHEDEQISGIAKITELIDPVWEDGSEVYERDQIIDAASLRLKSGLVQLTMKNGTTLILEGPTELTVSDSQKSFCPLGKVSAHVPPTGHGYEIVTPFGSVIDRGTEFFLNVSKEQSLVQTIKGKVDFLSTTEQLFPLGVNQTARINTLKRVSCATEKRHDQYFALPVFEHKVRERAQKYLTTKTQRDNERITDPDLLLFIDFNKKALSEIENPAHYTSSTEPRAIKGIRVPGPCFETYAWLFSKYNSGVYVNLPESCSSLTIDMLVRYQLSNKKSRVLLASSELFDCPGSILWQVTDEGALQFHILSKENTVHDRYCTSPVLLSRMRGTWVRLRVVLDAQNKTITQYVNGKRVMQKMEDKKSDLWRNIGLICPGKTIIGNSNNTKGGGSEQNLDMPIGEVTIYKKAVYP